MPPSPQLLRVPEQYRLEGTGFTKVGHVACCMVGVVDRVAATQACSDAVMGKGVP